jgi:hypothetical protein
MASFSSKLGTGQSTLGSMPLGDPGYTGALNAAPTSALVRGTFTKTAPSSTFTVKVAVRQAATTVLVRGTRKASVTASTVVKNVWTNSIPTQAVLRAYLNVNAPVSSYVLAKRGPLTIKSTVAIFPDKPIPYPGKLPRHSSVLPDSIGLLPVLYDTSPDSAEAIAVSVSTNFPPNTATSVAMSLINPTIAPILGAINLSASDLGNGNYQVAYTYYSDSGETALSPIANINLDQIQNEGIQVSGLSFPSGAQQIRYYLLTPQSSLFTLVATSTDNGPILINKAGQTVTVRIEGTLLEVVANDGEIPVFSCDLRDFTLGTLAHQILLAGYLASVTSGWEDLAATVLIDQFAGPSPSIGVEGYTSTLWRVIRPLALCFDQWEDDLDEAVRQLDVRYASGRWLDWWGILYGVPRSLYETDDRYRRRITYEVMAPRANNIAMEIILKEALGYESKISDNSGSATTWYTNRNPVGSPVRDVATGLATGAFSTDPQGAFVPGLVAWDNTATYNTATYTWAAGDPQTLTWGLINPTSATRPQTMWMNTPPLVDEANPPATWPGHPGRFHVKVNQVVENNQAGVQDILGLINRYKAAGFLFTLSVITHYSELYDTIKLVGELSFENWQESLATAAGVYFTTMTGASLTMQWPPPPAREATCFEEWSYNGGRTFIPFGTTAVLSRIPDPRRTIPRGLGGRDQIVLLAAPGIIPLG